MKSILFKVVNFLLLFSLSVLNAQIDTNDLNTIFKSDTGKTLTKDEVEKFISERPFKMAHRIIKNGKKEIILSMPKSK
ncbi:hypothetical protein [uncultured Psychroserpens sp.]|uniref:hypothetical protein n=1 Tax=uncultured Psychroserpens sp. TaxID=255436 RepID=UPI0026281CC3|nr:hypothetical protein [uncultured Psychroserpens sp.]